MQQAFQRLRVLRLPRIAERKRIAPIRQRAVYARAFRFQRLQIGDAALNDLRARFQQQRVPVVERGAQGVPGFLAKRMQQAVALVQRPGVPLQGIEICRPELGNLHIQ